MTRYIVHKLLMSALGARRPDDRDHYAQKRLDLAGPLLGQLFRQLFRKLSKDVQRYGQKCIDEGKEFSPMAAVRHKTISNGLKYALATGNWGQQKAAPGSVRAGVSQVLNRLTFTSSLSHLRRMNTPVGREGKLAKPRQLHNTHWGLVCPAETPEGQAVGLVKNLALMAYISVGSAPEPILEFLEEWATENLEEVQPSAISAATKVFVNGAWVGIHHDPDTLVKTLRDLRRAVEISAEVSVVRDIQNRELRLFSDAGRSASHTHAHTAHRAPAHPHTRTLHPMPHVPAHPLLALTPPVAIAQVLPPALHCQQPEAGDQEVSHPAAAPQGRDGLPVV